MLPEPGNGSSSSCGAFITLKHKHTHTHRKLFKLGKGQSDVLTQETGGYLSSLFLPSGRRREGLRNRDGEDKGRDSHSGP